MKKELYINDSPVIDFFLHHALPIAMMQGRYDNLIYGNFIQLFKSYRNEYLFDIYPRFGTGATFGDNVIDNIFENYILSGDFFIPNYHEFKNLVCSEIDKGYYFQTLSNEAIIPGTRFYKFGDFFCHQALYFGYDLNNDIFLMLNFDGYGKMCKIEVPIKIVYNSIFSEEMKCYLCANERVRKFNCYLFEFKKIKSDLYEKNFSNEKTLKKIAFGLQAYIQCIDLNSLEYFQYDRKAGEEWGINIYKIFKSVFNGEYNSKYALQGVCGLLEHKILMKKRIEFLKNLGFNIKKNDFYEIDEIIKKCEVIKNTFLLCDLKGSNIKLKRCSETIDLIKKTEENLIHRLINAIDKGY